MPLLVAHQDCVLWLGYDRSRHRTIAEGGRHEQRVDTGAASDQNAHVLRSIGDPGHIGVADRPRDVSIIVAGGAGIHSLFVPTSFSYRPVTRRIVRQS